MDTCGCGKTEGVFKSNSGTPYCCECWNAQVEARRKARKEQLAAMPRCEADGCKRRGTWLVGGHTHLCKTHLERAKTNRVVAAGPLGIVVWLQQAWTDRKSILRFANGVTAATAAQVKEAQ